LSILPSRIKQFAREAGFDLCGIAPVGEFRELETFPSWIADERHGEMKYMESRDESGELKRASLARVAPWARSVIVCAINYNTEYPYTTEATEATRGWISRYAWSREDYHESVLRRLRRVEERVRDEVSGVQKAQSQPSAAKAANGNKGLIAALKRCATQKLTFSAACKAAPSRKTDGAAEAVPFSDRGVASFTKPDLDDYPLSTNHLFRSYVDTGPLIERVYAKYAGIGWIGKNTCIINQKLGSWLFLGVILTSLELAADIPAPDRCGRCTRCLDACPTHAFVAPGELDARLCISYLTIEKRGEIPEDTRTGMGRHVFGCDICQDVCPWNRKAAIGAADEFQPREGLVNPALDWLAEMQAQEFREVFRGSPIRRAKLSGLRRNAVIAMGNSGNAKFVPTLKRLAEDADTLVAEHARWALDKLT
jgi:epoxyqueuosine reductase QueG